jgi:hypothetical protein
MLKNDQKNEETATKAGLKKPALLTHNRSGQFGFRLTRYDDTLEKVEKKRTRQAQKGGNKISRNLGPGSLFSGRQAGIARRVYSMRRVSRVSLLVTKEWWL